MAAAFSGALLQMFNHGLSAAALLQKRGFKTLLLESHIAVGGCADDPIPPPSAVTLRLTPVVVVAFV